MSEAEDSGSGAPCEKAAQNGSVIGVTTGSEPAP